MTPSLRIVHDLGLASDDFDDFIAWLAERFLSRPIRLSDPE